MDLTTKIKEYALNIGFAKVGITNMDNFTDFEEEILSRGELYDRWRQRLIKGSKPKEVFPKGKSIIVLAYDYFQKDFPADLTKMIGRIYLSRSYIPLPESTSAKRIELFKDFLTKNNIDFMPDNNNLPIRRLALRAGVTTFGKNNFAYVPGVGSFIVLYAFIVDKELKYDKPMIKNECPKNCTKCIDACPTNAIYEPYKLNPSKCIAFNNFIRRSEDDESLSSTVPLDIRKGIGSHIHRCDICQEVCPRNKEKIQSDFPNDQYIQTIKNDLTLENLLNMPGNFYEDRVYPIMYNYIKDKKYFSRNAAIAMGNTKDEKYLKDLKLALSSKEKVIRIHAAWAIKNIGGEEANQILEEHLKNETSIEVINEIKNII